MERVTKTILVFSVILLLFLDCTEGGRTVSTQHETNSAYRPDDFLSSLLDSFSFPLTKEPSPSTLGGNSIEPFEPTSEPVKPDNKLSDGAPKYDGDTDKDSPKSDDSGGNAYGKPPKHENPDEGAPKSNGHFHWNPIRGNMPDEGGRRSRGGRNGGATKGDCSESGGDGKGDVEYTKTIKSEISFKDKKGSGSEDIAKSIYLKVTVKEREKDGRGDKNGEYDEGNDKDGKGYP